MMFLIHALELSIFVYAAGAVRPQFKSRSDVKTIALEEAWQLPDLAYEAASYAPPLGQTTQDLANNLVDIQGQRLQLMDQYGIDYMILSWTSPGPQGYSNQTEAEYMATYTNDYMYENIKNNTDRFGGFAALSMHDPAQAAAELNRTVTEYGFVGALLNDYQQSGPDNDTLLFYDQPQYDVLWKMATDLDVPIYMHPRLPITEEIDLLWEGRHWLLTAPWQFANDLSTHVLGLAVNSVFDRFPSLRIIVGHNGERIPSDFWRADHMLQRQALLGMPMNGTIFGYLKKNIWLTTSGEFYDHILRYHIEEIGGDRILFSVDYPYETVEEAATWFDQFPFTNESERYAIARGNAIDVLKLKLV